MKTESCTYTEKVERCGHHYCDTYYVEREGRRNVATSYEFVMDVFNAAGTAVASYGFSETNLAGLDLETSCR